MKTLYLDLETFSETPIKNGTYRYAADAEIMLFAWAIDDEPPSVWDLTAGEPMPERLRDAWYDEEVEIVASNSMFDRTVLAYAFKKFTNYQPPIARWRDTMVQALCHGLPGGLAALCELFKIDVASAKDKAGKDLIQLFCKPRPKGQKIRRATAATHPVEWSRFKAYAGSDILSMRALRKVLPSWNYPGIELPRWHLDQAINDRGFAVDTDLAAAAVRACDAAKARMATRTQELTGDEVQRTTQRDALLRHLLEWYGVALPDMQSSTLEARVNDENLPWPVRELLAIRLEAGQASVAKYKTLLKAVNDDARVRGALQFSGANRTGRWAGRVLQPQNLPRPSMKQDDIDGFIAAVKTGCEDLLYPDTITAASNAIRGVIVAQPGKKLVVSDLSNIEGRMLAWLAGEEWKLDAFRAFDGGKGHDLYKLTAGNVLRKAPEEITKDERQAAGKVPELACGYQGAVGAFKSMAALYGLDLPEQRVLEIVRAWRAANPNIMSFWYELEEAARIAILNPNRVVQCRKVSVRRDGAWLRIVLPSGRSLCYASPRIDNDKISYMGMCPYSKKWKRLKTYGGKLVENVTQAAAAEVLKSNMPAIEAAGYEIVLTVHDEVITETPDDSRYNVNDLSMLLATVPAWAPGIPLAAGGFEGHRYKKDG
jgi:DNA polymerase